MVMMTMTTTMLARSARRVLLMRGGVRGVATIGTTPSWLQHQQQQQQQHGGGGERRGYNSTANHVSAAATLLGMLVGGGGATLLSSPAVLVHCEEAATTPYTTTPQEEYTPAPNPVWPSGLCEADMNALVEDCLADSSINISAIPDYLERQIYRSTIKLTLNAMYETLGDLHGTDLLGHELRIQRIADKDAGRKGIHREFRLAQMRGSVAEDVLDRVVDGLLANKAVNQPLIPDIVERQLYKNCLTIIFRLLDMMAATFSVTCCGHDLRFTVEPSKNASVHTSAVQQATQIDPQLMLEYSRQMGVDPESSDEVDTGRSWWDRFFRPAQKELLAQLHATLYSLVLGILDDVLNQTKIRLLSDTLEFDLVPVPLEVQQAKKAAAAMAAAKNDNDDDNDDDQKAAPPPHESSVALPFATFTAGLGVGITLMSLLGKRQ